MAIYNFDWAPLDSKITNSIFDHPLLPVASILLFCLGVFLSIEIKKSHTVLLLLPFVAVVAHSITNVEPSVPDNAVVAFYQEKCPPNWTDFYDVSGRVIVGSGKPVPAIDPYSGAKISERIFKHTGGHEEVTLTEDHVPAHTHRNGVFSRLVATQGEQHGNGRPLDHVAQTTSNANNRTKRIDIIESAVLKSFGGDIAHQNMPPFIVLKYCRKLSNSERNNKS